nr:immunoglobulin heavy chain junction region [Macaca mulatta]MOW75846.1 immunoglobulin heavy chain junction region [Macaca mulatta]MOW79755.1 immunoglobulin heavy chain junction region [Macaca mulatta]MOW81524.1 immunoglobulin heavy chain junction region [Macaca mulatta]MOW82394.1 immunoglobulin heavy chain junction region [Macaca mulatta]
CTRDQSGFDYW